MHSILDAFVAQTGTGGGSGGLISLAPILLMFVVFYFLLIRPQQKQAKKHQDFVTQLQRGQEVVLNEALNVVAAGGTDRQGEVVRLKERLDPTRVVVSLRADEERVVELAQALTDTPLQVGDHLRLEPRAGLVLEKLPKPEVEALLLLHFCGRHLPICLRGALCGQRTGSVRACFRTGHPATSMPRGERRSGGASGGGVKRRTFYVKTTSTGDGSSHREVIPGPRDCRTGDSGGRQDTAGCAAPLLAGAARVRRAIHLGRTP